MRLFYSAAFAVILGIALVFSPLIFTGVSPTDLKVRAGQSQSCPPPVINNATNESSLVEYNFSTLKADNASSQYGKECALGSPYSLYGVFSIVVLGIIVATFSYFAMKRVAGGIVHT